MNSSQVLELLRLYESRNITHIAADRSWPIVWDRARNCSVWDANGKRYLDVTAAFGVAAAGHANPRVVKAAQAQLARLPHAMGDVHPHALKARLAQTLSRITFERWDSLPGSQAKTIFCNSGFEAVEAALKTALLATGKSEIGAFEGAYHGLGYGALHATHRPFFRQPFLPQLRNLTQFFPFPQTTDELPLTLRQIDQWLARGHAGALVVEPVQGRGGIRIPPPDFLPELRQLCDRHHVFLILDEIFTGFGRTGQWFACEHSKTIPDLICLGKGLTGGFPLSACVGNHASMDAAWPLSTGEAIHTSTFLGHPVGCAMALAHIEEIDRLDLVSQSAECGRFLLERLNRLVPPRGFQLIPRGLGLMAGLEIRADDGAPATTAAMQIVQTMLDLGVIILPDGSDSNVLAFTPPLTISPKQLATACTALRLALSHLNRSVPPPNTGTSRKSSSKKHAAHAPNGSL